MAMSLWRHFLAHPVHAGRQADGTASAGVGSHGRLHTALQAQCTRLLRQNSNYRYPDIEQRLLPYGV